MVEKITRQLSVIRGGIDPAECPTLDQELTDLWPVMGRERPTGDSYGISCTMSLWEILPNLGQVTLKTLVQLETRDSAHLSLNYYPPHSLGDWHTDDFNSTVLHPTSGQLHYKRWGRNKVLETSAGDIVRGSLTRTKHCGANSSDIPRQTLVIFAHR